MSGTFRKTRAKKQRPLKQEDEEFGFDDPFYQAEILAAIENRLGTECEIEDMPEDQIYWSGGYEIINQNIKIRCERKGGEDIILVATVGRIYVSGGEVVGEKTYPVDRVVNELLRKYKILYGDTGR
jgi:hypothetical protein